MALTEKLTAIGDAIREKTETTELLTLDGMAAAIAGIETGGGAAYTSGEIKLSEAKTIGNTLETALEITHNLGKKPKLFMLVYTGTAYSNSNHLKNFVYTNRNNTVSGTIHVTTGENPYMGGEMTGYAKLYDERKYGSIVDENTIKIIGRDANTMMCKDNNGNNTYRWIAEG